MPNSFVDEWRDCQQRVSELEREYAAAMVAYCQGEGAAPDGAMKAALTDMRAQAAALLSRALGDLDRRIADADRRASENRSGPPRSHRDPRK